MKILLRHETKNRVTRLLFDTETKKYTYSKDRYDNFPYHDIRIEVKNLEEINNTKFWLDSELKYK